MFNDTFVAKGSAAEKKRSGRGRTAVTLEEVSVVSPRPSSLQAKVFVQQCTRIQTNEMITVTEQLHLRAPRSPAGDSGPARGSPRPPPAQRSPSGHPAAPSTILCRGAQRTRVPGQVTRHYSEASRRKARESPNVSAKDTACERNFSERNCETIKISYPSSIRRILNLKQSGILKEFGRTNPKFGRNLDGSYKIPCES